MPHSEAEVLHLFPAQEAYTIEVNGPPVPWTVVPTVVRSKVQGKPPTATVNIATESKRYQRRIAKAAHKVLPRQLRGLLRVEVVFVHARPKSLKGVERAWHGVAPDLDKCLRNVFDGLQRGPTGKARGRTRPRDALGNVLPWPGAISDDCRVVSATVEDWYAAEGENPHTVIRITELS